MKEETDQVRDIIETNKMLYIITNFKVHLYNIMQNYSKEGIF
jgi:hypothetical protein